jgi:uncharacterized protein (DUF924 family)
MEYQTILSFWFEEIDSAAWWAAEPAFDAQLRTRFGTLLQQATACELFAWRTTPHGRLAEILVLDQFSRNIYRGTPQAFAQDPQALALAQEAVALNAYAALTPIERGFLFSPYMHSESRVVHAVAEPLYRAHVREETLEFEIRHKAIIDRFGHYPHRNDILGRASTLEEIEFLKQPNSKF